MDSEAGSLEQLGDKPVFNIDLAQMGELAQTGVRRAVLFMGISLNAEEFQGQAIRQWRELTAAA